MVKNIQQTLKSRAKQYGDFESSAHVAQQLKGVMADAFQFIVPVNPINSTHVEALELIMTKIARIITGDPNHADSWHDIAGYATLVEGTLNGIKVTRINVKDMQK